MSGTRTATWRGRGGPRRYDDRDDRPRSAPLAPALVDRRRARLRARWLQPGDPDPSASCRPTSAASVASSEPSTPPPSAGASSSALPAGQTDTDWGRIWDALPAAFPVYPGAAPADEAETGPVSATFALEGQEARTVATWMQTELERAGYRTEALNGPLEDGSFVLESTGAGGLPDRGRPSRRSAG